MSAPVSLQPLAVNDPRPARPVYYVSRGSAESAAHRAARLESPTGRVAPVEHACGILRAYEGGKGFEVRLADFYDFEVVELSEAEVSRRVQSGIRALITEQYEKAAKEVAAGSLAKTDTFRRIHAKWATEARDRARELELKLALVSVREAEPEPITSSERDNRLEASR